MRRKQSAARIGVRRIIGLVANLVQLVSHVHFSGRTPGAWTSRSGGERRVMGSRPAGYERMHAKRRAARVLAGVERVPAIREGEGHQKYEFKLGLHSVL